MKQKEMTTASVALWLKAYVDVTWTHRCAFKVDSVTLLVCNAIENKY